MVFYEYLHLTSVYFNTGIYPTIDTVVEIDNCGLNSHNGENWPGVFSSEGPSGEWGNNKISIATPQSSPGLFAGFGNKDVEVSVTYGSRYNVRLDKDNFTVDGTQYPLGITSLGTSNIEFVLGGRNTSNGVIMLGDIFAGNIRIYQGGVLVLEWKPTIYNGEYTYYDTVSHTYATKNGSGTIEPGPLATTFEPSQDSFNFNTQGGTASFTVTADNAWTAATPTYFTMSPLSGSAGETTVTITAPVRLTDTNETVTFTDSDQNTFDISIEQSDNNITPNLTMYRGSTAIKKMYYGGDLVYRKMSHSPSLTLSVDSLVIDPNGGNGTFTVTTDGTFTATTSDSWITLSTSGTTVTVTATATSDNRSGSVTVTATNGFITKTATVAVSQSVYSGMYVENVDNTTGTLTIYEGSNLSNNLEYSSDGVNWTTATTGQPCRLTVPAGSKLYLRGTNSNWRQNSDGHNVFSMDVNWKIGGNLLSIIDKDNYATLQTVPNYAFQNAFSMNTNLLDASNSNLGTATTLNRQSLHNMFRYSGITGPVDTSSITTINQFGILCTCGGCTNLTKPLELRNATSVSGTSTATVLYENCTSLPYVIAPSVTSWDTSVFSEWMKGVAASGVVYKPSSLSIPTNSISGVPSGWTTADYPV